MKTLISLLLIMLFASCKNYKERNDELIAGYPYEVQNLVQDFCHYGYDRQLKIDLKKLQIELVSDIPPYTYGDVVAYYKRDEHKIYFDTTRSTWKNNRESLVFHELGHAILKRGHVRKYQDGYQISYMNVAPNKPEFTWIRLARIEELFSDPYQRNVAQFHNCNH